MFDRPVPVTALRALTRAVLLHVREGVCQIAAPRWADAGAAANQALDIDAEDKDAKSIKARAQVETNNQTRYQTFEKAVADKDYAGVARGYAAIDTDSMYKENSLLSPERC